MAKTKENLTGFPERLQQLRAQKRLSQADLAKLVKVHHNNISRYERGDSVPNAKVLNALATALGVSTDYLYDGETEGAAVADLKDAELLKMFQKAANLPEEKKEYIKTTINLVLKSEDMKNLAAS